MTEPRNIPVNKMFDYYLMKYFALMKIPWPTVGSG